MDMAFWVLVVIVFLALAFDFINGFHDAANAIATVVSTRVLSPKTAVIFGAVLNFGGALLGTEVAATVGKGLVDQQAVTLETVFFALLASILWNLYTWYRGLPTSSSHALIGSLLGAAWFSSASGPKAIHLDAVFQKVLAPMVVSPLLGFMAGFILMGLLTWLVYRISILKIKQTFGKLQIVSAGLMALSHGHNDAQKSMGIIALALVTLYPGDGFQVPLWVIVSCAVAMGLGTLSGGWRIIRTLGSKMIKLQPIHGFAAETTAAGVIMAASHVGIPLSTTHVISSAIMGVGSTKRLSAVKWGVVARILWAWVLTIPATFAVSGLLMGMYRYWVPAGGH
ncbi:MAG: inorganic phosphate transporter [Candidatus Melainabacteria bacterium]|nr:inorganic phosphate transporter [Candidatus Melainabacteria bacterium]